MQQVQFINPPELPAHGYSNVVTVQGPTKTIYIGGQNAVNARGEIIGVGDIAAQSSQVMDNIEIALAAAGAKLDHVIKWTVLLVEGTDLRAGYAVFQTRWGDRPNPPIVTAAMVAALARPEFLVEIDAIAVVPLEGE